MSSLCSFVIKMPFPVLSRDIRIYSSTLAGCLAEWVESCVCAAFVCVTEKHTSKRKKAGHSQKYLSSERGPVFGIKHSVIRKGLQSKNFGLRSWVLTLRIPMRLQRLLK